MNDIKPQQLNEPVEIQIETRHQLDGRTGFQLVRHAVEAAQSGRVALRRNAGILGEQGDFAAAARCLVHSTGQPQKPRLIAGEAEIGAEREYASGRPRGNVVERRAADLAERRPRRRCRFIEGQRDRIKGHADIDRAQPRRQHLVDQLDGGDFLLEAGFAQHEPGKIRPPHLQPAGAPLRRRDADLLIQPHSDAIEIAQIGSG
nr:hypothetical protein [Tistrella mobilis]